MKKLFLLLVLIGCAIAYQSCTDKDINPITDQQKSVIDPDYIKGYVYPLSKAYQRIYPRSRSTSFETDWENYTQVTLNSGESVNLPWANLTDSNIPLQIAHDVKKEDGWKLLLHTFSTSTDSSNGRNYMILYNQRTGILKVLYYLEPTHTWANNTGFWTINLTVPNKLLNFVQELAVPMNVGNIINYCTVNNASTKSIISFRAGWNGFQVQLAYDNSNLDGTYLDISTDNMNITKANLFGEFDGASTGTLITHGSKTKASSLNSSHNMASLFGTTAQTKINKFSTKSRSFLGGIGKIVEAAKKVVSNLNAGSSKPTNTVTDLSFQTKLKGTITGEFESPANSPVVNMRVLFSPQRIGCNLGVWNLTESPTIYIHPLADIIPEANDIQTPYLEHWYKFRGITGYKYNLVINPDLNEHIISKWVDINIVRYYTNTTENPLNQIPNFDYGNLVSANGHLENHACENENSLIYGNYRDKNSMYIDDMKAKVYTRHDMSQRIDPPVIFLPKTQTYEEKYFKPNQHYLKFTLYLVTEFEGKRDTTMSSHTFTPRIEWDPVLYDQYKNVPMENLR